MHDAEGRVHFLSRLCSKEPQLQRRNNSVGHRHADDGVLTLVFTLLNKSFSQLRLLLICIWSVWGGKRKRDEGMESIS